MATKIEIDRKTVITSEDGRFQASFSNDENFVGLRIPIGHTRLSRMAWVKKDDFEALIEFSSEIAKIIKGLE